MDKIINFRCKNCRLKIRVSSSHVGKRGKCPKCKTVVLIQTPDEILLDEVRELINKDSLAE